MSSILLHWVNEELPLREEKIISLEEAFANGFLFGKILDLFNQQPSFVEFVDGQDFRHEFRNFVLLERSMVSLGIRFTSDICLDLLSRKSHTATHLLYKLKMAIERLVRKERNCLPSHLPPSEWKKLPMLCLHQSEEKQRHLLSNRIVFEKALRRMLLAQNKRLENQILSRFHGRGATTRKEAINHKLREREAEWESTEEKRIQSRIRAEKMRAERMLALQNRLRTEPVSAFVYDPKRVKQLEQKHARRKEELANARRRQKRDADVTEVASGLEEFEKRAAAVSTTSQLSGTQAGGINSEYADLSLESPSSSSLLSSTPFAFNCPEQRAKEKSYTEKLLQQRRNHTTQYIRSQYQNLSMFLQKENVRPYTEFSSLTRKTMNECKLSEIRRAAVCEMLKKVKSNRESFDKQIKDAQDDVAQRARKAASKQAKQVGKAYKDEVRKECNVLKKIKHEVYERHQATQRSVGKDLMRDVFELAWRVCTIREQLPTIQGKKCGDQLLYLGSLWRCMKNEFVATMGKGSGASQSSQDYCTVFFPDVPSIDGHPLSVSYKAQEDDTESKNRLCEAKGGQETFAATPCDPGDVGRKFGELKINAHLSDLGQPTGTFPNDGASEQNLSSPDPSGTEHRQMVSALARELHEYAREIDSQSSEFAKQTYGKRKFVLGDFVSAVEAKLGMYDNEMSNDSPSQSSQDTEGVEPREIRIVLQGNDYTTVKRIGNALATRCNLHVIDVRDLIAEAVSQRPMGGPPCKMGEVSSTFISSVETDDIQLSETSAAESEQERDGFTRGQTGFDGEICEAVRECLATHGAISDKLCVALIMQRVCKLRATRGQSSSVESQQSLTNCGSKTEADSDDANGGVCIEQSTDTGEQGAENDTGKRLPSKSTVVAKPEGEIPGMSTNTVHTRADGLSIISKRSSTLEASKDESDDSTEAEIRTHGLGNRAKGWVLVNFPQNQRQANQLWKKLSDRQFDKSSQASVAPVTSSMDNSKDVDTEVLLKAELRQFLAPTSSAFFDMEHEDSAQNWSVCTNKIFLHDQQKSFEKWRKKKEKQEKKAEKKKSKKSKPNYENRAAAPFSAQTLETEKEARNITPQYSELPSLQALFEKHQQSEYLYKLLQGSEMCPVDLVVRVDAPEKKLIAWRKGWRSLELPLQLANRLTSDSSEKENELDQAVDENVSMISVFGSNAPSEDKSKESSSSSTSSGKLFINFSEEDNCKDISDVLRAISQPSNMARHGTHIENLCSTQEIPVLTAVEKAAGRSSYALRKLTDVFGHKDDAKGLFQQQLEVSVALGTILKYGTTATFDLEEWEGNTLTLTSDGGARVNIVQAERAPRDDKIWKKTFKRYKEQVREEQELVQMLCRRVSVIETMQAKQLAIKEAREKAIRRRVAQVQEERMRSNLRSRLEYKLSKVKIQLEEIEEQITLAEKKKKHNDLSGLQSKRESLLEECNSWECALEIVNTETKDEIDRQLSWFRESCIMGEEDKRNSEEKLTDNNEEATVSTEPIAQKSQVSFPTFLRFGKRNTDELWPESEALQAFSAHHGEKCALDCATKEMLSRMLSNYSSVEKNFSQNMRKTVLMLHKQALSLIRKLGDSQTQITNVLLESEPYLLVEEIVGKFYRSLHRRFCSDLALSCPWNGTEDVVQEIIDIEPNSFLNEAPERLETSGAVKITNAMTGPQADGSLETKGGEVLPDGDHDAKADDTMNKENAGPRLPADLSQLYLLQQDSCRATLLSIFEMHVQKSLQSFSSERRTQVSEKCTDIEETRKALIEAAVREQLQTYLSMIQQEIDRVHGIEEAIHCFFSEPSTEKPGETANADLHSGVKHAAKDKKLADKKGGKMVARPKQTTNKGAHESPKEMNDDSDHPTVPHFALRSLQHDGQDDAEEAEHSVPQDKHSHSQTFKGNKDQVQDGRGKPSRDYRNDKESVQVDEKQKKTLLEALTEVEAEFRSIVDEALGFVGKDLKNRSHKIPRSLSDGLDYQLEMSAARIDRVRSEGGRFVAEVAQYAAYLCEWRERVVECKFANDSTCIEHIASAIEFSISRGALPAGFPVTKPVTVDCLFKQFEPPDLLVSFPAFPSIDDLEIELSLESSNFPEKVERLSDIDSSPSNADAQ